MLELIKPRGKSVGVVFTEPLNAKIPQFGTSKEEYKKLFEEKFILKVFTNCYNSIKPRAGRELFIYFVKKEL